MRKRRAMCSGKAEGFDHGGLEIEQPADVERVDEGLVQRGLKADQEIAVAIGVGDAGGAEDPLAFGHLGLHHTGGSVGFAVLAQIAYPEGPCVGLPGSGIFSNCQTYWSE